MRTCLELVGSARDVLLIGVPNEDLLAEPETAARKLTCISLSGERADAELARVYCSEVYEMSPDDFSLEQLSGARFDAVLIDGTAGQLIEPLRTLTEARLALRDCGVALGLIPTAAKARAGRMLASAGYRVKFLRSAGGVSIVRAQPIPRKAAIVSGLRAEPAVALRGEDWAQPDTNIMTLAARRGQLRAELAEERRVADDLRRELRSAKAHAAAVESALALRESATSALREEREGERQERAALLQGFSEKALALAYAHRELERAREEIKRLSNERDRSRAEADAIDRAYRQSEESVAELQSKIADGGVYVAGLLEQIAAKDGLIAENSYSTRMLEQHLEVQRDLAEAVRKAALADKLTTREYIDDLRSSNERLVGDLRRELHGVSERERSLREAFAQTESRLSQENKELRERLQDLSRRSTETESELRLRLTETERELLLQNEMLVSDMQAESALLATLVDTVQSSHFWKIKRWLHRWFRKPVE
jgi:hypothetical protein